MKDFHRQVMDWLRGLGAEEVSYTNGGSHPRILFTYAGQSRFYVMPGSPRNERDAIMNSQRDIRRMLGLTPTQKRVGRRREHKDRVRVDKAGVPTTITPGKNWQAALLYHPTVDLRARLDEAYLRLWRHCMQGWSRL